MSNEICNARVARDNINWDYIWFERWIFHVSSFKYKKVFLSLAAELYNRDVKWL